MSGIKMLGLAILTTTGISFSSCSNDLELKKQNYKNYVFKSGITADKFQALDDSIEKLSGNRTYTSGTEGIDGIKAFAWKEIVDKIKLKHNNDSIKKTAIDSTRKAVLDSVELAKKAVKHL